MIFLLLILLAVQEIGLKEPLELKAYLDAPSPWYPNQEGKILYRIRYKGKVQLTAEELPLLDPKGFEKVGDKIVENRDELDYSVQDFYQIVKPLKGGLYTLPASLIEGFLYEIKEGKIVPYQKVRSELPSFEVVITPFPLEGQPPFFNDSVGSFQFSLSRIGVKKVQTGDWINLEWDAKGKSLSSLNFPKIACLPGVAGFFRLDDLPIQVQDAGETRKYFFRIAPLVPGIASVPPLSWAIFDPSIGQYTVWKSEPIPLTFESTPTSPPLTYKATSLSPLTLEGANPYFEKGEIPLTLLELQRGWRKSPWDLKIKESLHAVEERMGLSPSPFPYFFEILRALEWALLPLLLLAFWTRSPYLIGCLTLLTLFLLTPFAKENRAVVLTSTLAKEGGNTLFLAGETVQIHSIDDKSAQVSSERQMGTLPLSSLIKI